MSIISEKVEKSVNKTSFDDDEVNFEEAVIETSAVADEDWAAKTENWQEAAESEAVQAATEEGWASWNETQQYKRQESRDSNIQVRLVITLKPKDTYIGSKSLSKNRAFLHLCNTICGTFRTPPSPSKCYSPLTLMPSLRPTIAPGMNFVTPFWPKFNPLLSTP